jgi:hypothetical protein
LRNGEIARDDAAKLKLFTDVTGREWSQLEIIRYVQKHGIRHLTIARANDQKGDVLMQRHQAFVLSQEMLSRMDAATLEDLVATLAKRGIGFGGAKVAPFHSVAAHLMGDYTVIPKSQWTRTEQAVIANVEQAYALDRLVRHLYPLQGHDYWRTDEKAKRELRIGLSDVANAWTDGRTYICLERKYLARIGQDVSGWQKVAALMLHEYAHDDPTTDSHTHTPEFYRRYHDAHEIASELGAELTTNYANVLRGQNRRLSSTLLRNADRIARIFEEQANLAEMEAATKKFEEAKATAKEVQRKHGKRKGTTWR